MSVEDAAKRMLAEICAEQFDGIGVVVTDSVIARQIPKRRAVTLEKATGRLSDTVRAVVSNLGQGGDLDSAAEIARSAGFHESIHIARGYAQLVLAVADRFRAGDNVWSDNSGGDGIVVIHFWNDPTHGRVY
ncbi:MAG TPA: hypothetical protein VK986_10210 [Tepidisphaeraceae bacterium]|nr:hypothetical protein [Tepidisphaeraceae bacterium]